MAKKAKKAKRAAKRVVAKKKSVAAIPKGYHTLTASFAGPEVEKEIEFLKAAFGAKVRDLFHGPDGKVAHCEMQVGDSRVMCGTGMEGQAWTLHASVYVKDCDATFAKAVAAGATVKEPLTDKFYGDRNGRVVSPFGNEWSIGTHKEDVSPKEMERRMAEMMKGHTA